MEVGKDCIIHPQRVDNEFLCFYTDVIANFGLSIPFVVFEDEVLKAPKFAYC